MKASLYLSIVLLSMVLVAAASAQPSMKQHDCLGATSGSPVTILSGATATGAAVTPLGASQTMAGFLTFTGAGTIAVTVQTKRAGSSTWFTPSTGATALSASAAGSHHFLISVPPCEALRLIYTAAAGNASVTDAFAIDQHE